MISIVIPAFKNAAYLTRLLQSVAEQSFTDYEVIVTDDSPDREVEDLCKVFSGKIPMLHYYRNAVRKGMGGNWNEALQKASGEWIKIMHDDDWFSGPGSLKKFAKMATSDIDFVFSAYRNYYEKSNSFKVFRNRNLAYIQKEPMLLFANNSIGAPSCVMVRKTMQTRYDEDLRWRIDIDYYIRLMMETGRVGYIDEPLVNIGIGKNQVTSEVKLNKDVELKEALIFQNKYGLSSLLNPVVFDGWWRMFRNLGIRKREDVSAYGDWDVKVLDLIDDIAAANPGLLKNGFYSKWKMYQSFLEMKKTYR